jgi:hypothetical protein
MQRIGRIVASGAARTVCTPSVRRVALGALAVGTLAACTGRSGPSDGWTPLFDGRSLAGWRASENPATFRVEHGAIVVHGPRAHLFYDGPVMGHRFTDFELKADVMTRPGANSGIFLRTTFQPDGWPAHGYEVQVNNSHADWRRTGSLYGVRDVREAERDGEWFTVHAVVRGRRVRVLVNGRPTVDYTEPAGSPTRLTGTTIAIQGHDPASEVHYRNLVVRPLAP